MPFVPPPFNHEALTAARLSAALSRAAVAAQVGVHRQRVYDWESGTSTPHPRHLPALAAAVGVRPEALVVGRSLRSRRYATGLTQAEAAAAVGAARSEWCRWEGGLQIPARFVADVAGLVGSWGRG